MRYPYSSPHLSKEDFDSVIAVLEGQFLTQGPAVRQLEAALENLFSVKHAVVCNSGTAALHMAYKGLGLGPNAGLLTSPITFLATANAARMCNAPVQFADVDPIVGNVTIETIQAAAAKASFPIKIIAIVHLGGRPCADIEEINIFARSIGATVVEDACHAPTAQYYSKDGHNFQIGSCAHSQAATLSFHAIKHITTGEGGVLLTQDQKLAEQARLLRSHGMVRDAGRMQNKKCSEAPWYYEMHELGYNYRLSDLNCALAIHQIDRLKENIQRRAQIAEQYNTHLSGLRHITLPEIPDPKIAVHAWHLYAPAFDFDSLGITRKKFMSRLSSHGIGSQVHYIPLYRQPYYRTNSDFSEFSGAESYYKQTLSIPMYFGLTDDDIGEISDCIKALLNN